MLKHVNGANCEKCEKLNCVLNSVKNVIEASVWFGDEKCEKIRQFECEML